MFGGERFAGRTEVAPEASFHGEAAHATHPSAYCAFLWAKLRVAVRHGGAPGQRFTQPESLIHASRCGPGGSSVRYEDAAVNAHWPNLAESDLDLRVNQYSIPMHISLCLFTPHIAGNVSQVMFIVETNSSRISYRGSPSSPCRDTRLPRK